MSDLTLFGFPLSANAHRVRLMLSLLGLQYQYRSIDLAKSEQKGPEFTALNPLQRVPVLQDGDKYVTESHAILIYLAELYSGSSREQWWPTDPFSRALVGAWLFFSAGDLHHGIGLSRNEVSFGIPSGGDMVRQRAARAMETLESHLADRDWLELRRPTLADVALYPFVAVTAEAGLTASYPSVSAWVARLSALPGFLPMPLLRDLRR